MERGGSSETEEWGNERITQKPPMQWKTCLSTNTRISTVYNDKRIYMSINSIWTQTSFYAHLKKSYLSNLSKHGCRGDE